MDEHVFAVLSPCVPFPLPRPDSRPLELRFPKEKSAIWAHNHHIARHSTEYYGGYTIMGTLLAEQLGSNYVPIALTSHEA